MNGTARRPTTKSSRHQLIVDLLAGHEVRSQPELLDLLAEQGRAGHPGDALARPGGARRRPGAVARPAPWCTPYRPRAATVARPRPGRPPPPATGSAGCWPSCWSAPTPAPTWSSCGPRPGAAQFLASALDKVEYPEVLGTIAGDDTVLLIGRDPAGGDDLARRLLALAQQPAP